MRFITRKGIVHHIVCVTGREKKQGGVADTTEAMHKYEMINAFERRVAFIARFVSRRELDLFTL